jgi:SOS response regulatory protein OraA/RecX
MLKMFHHAAFAKIYANSLLKQTPKGQLVVSQKTLRQGLGRRTILRISQTRILPIRICRLKLIGIKEGIGKWTN